MSAPVTKASNNKAIHLNVLLSFLLFQDEKTSPSTKFPAERVLFDGCSDDDDDELEQLEKSEFPISFFFFLPSSIHIYI